MSEIDELLAGEGPVAREVKYRGKTATKFFRRITGGERLKLQAGQKMHIGADKRGEMVMGLDEMTRSRQLLVQFASVFEDGKQVYKSLAEVQALPDDYIVVLAEHAEAVTEDAGEAGNA